MHDIWKKRQAAYLAEVQRYAKYMVTGHMVIVLLFAFGAVGYAYSQWLQTPHPGVPGAAIAGFALALFIVPLEPKTLLQPADALFFLPLELSMKDYMARSLRLTVASRIPLALFAFCALLPLVRNTGAEGEGWAVALIAAYIAAINALAEYRARQAFSDAPAWRDRAARLALNTAALALAFAGRWPLALGFGLALQLYVLALGKRAQGQPFAFERWIADEEARMMRFYRFASLFVDVPHLRGRIRSRRWLTLPYRFVPRRQDKAMLYLQWRTFIRSDDLFYLWLRLTAVSAALAAFIHSPLLLAAVAAAVSYASALQVRQGLLGNRAFRPDRLYPVEAGDRLAAAAAIVRTVQLLQFAVVFAAAFAPPFNGWRLLAATAVLPAMELAIRIANPRGGMT